MSKHSSNIARYKARRAAGLCIDCPTPSPTHVRCEACGRRQSDAQAARYTRVVAEGKCPTCRRPAVKDHVYCAHHLRDNRNRTRRMREAQRGRICGNCNTRPPRPGMMTCQYCADWKRAWRQRKAKADHEQTR